MQLNSDVTAVRKSSADVEVMLVSRDQETINLLSNILCRIGICVQHYTDESSAIANLPVTRFEAVVLDLDSIGNVTSFITSVRTSHISRNALIFGVAAAERHCVVQHGINFVFKRPFQREQVKSILQIVYDLMLQDRRRYYRHSISAPVRLKRSSGGELDCTTINVSRNGAAVCVPTALELGEAIEVILSIPEAGSEISARGTVIWDDRHGKAGLRFVGSTVDNQRRLDKWLDAQFYQRFNRPRRGGAS